MIGALLSFLAFYLVHPLHTLVAVVAGSCLHVSLKALWLRLRARAKQGVASIRS